MNQKLKAYSIFFFIMCFLRCSPSVQADFAIYYATFQELTHKNPWSISIQFEDNMPGTMVGVCFRGQGKILIDRKFWDKHPSHLMREMVVAHELGHCLLERDHEHGTVLTIEGNIPSSLMQTELFSETIFNKHKKQYYLELVTRRF